MESIPSRIERSEELSSEKQELLRLETEGKWLFHGTGLDLEELTPKQSIDSKTGPDGEPAVFASDKAEYAIFMAIVHRVNSHTGRAQSSSGAVFDDDKFVELKFGMPRDTRDNLKVDARGWVYVFDRNQFIEHPTKKGVEFVCYAPVRPVRKIEVHKADLPADIEIEEGD
jgi:hypothetical protein